MELIWCWLQDTVAKASFSINLKRFFIIILIVFSVGTADLSPHVSSASASLETDKEMG